MHEPHGKHRIILLTMCVYRYVAWKQTSYCSVRFLGANHIETQFTLYCCHVLKGAVYCHCIETAILLLLPVSVAVRMFTDICHNPLIQF
jgi:hypothetical protein